MRLQPFIVVDGDVGTRRRWHVEQLAREDRERRGPVDRRSTTLVELRADCGSARRTTVEQTESVLRAIPALAIATL